MEHFDGERCHLHEIAEHLLVAQGQRIKDAAANLSRRLGHILVGILTILTDSIYHRSRIGKECIVGIDERAESLHLHGRALQFGMRQLLHFLGPFLAATLIEPHTADVLQETGGSLNSAFVGEVALIRKLVDDGVLGLNAHQRPGAAGEIGELLVLCRHGSHGRSCIVTSHGIDGDGSQSCHLLHFVGQSADHRAGIHHLAELTATEANRLQQPFVELLGARVKEFRCRGDGIFAYFVAGQHP